MSTMSDVAREAGVSIMTVSRVATNSGYVKSVTKQKVLRAMNQVGYSPKHFISAHHATLTLIVPDITNPFFTFIARGVEDIAQMMGYRVFLANTDENIYKENEYIDMCISLKTDGVIIVPVGDASKQHLITLQKANIPFVLIDRQVSDIEADLVKGNIGSASYSLVSHLIQLGHRRIALVTFSRNSDASRDRISGYLEALKYHGLNYDEQLIIESALTHPLDVRFLDDLLAMEKPPTAFFLANSILYNQIFHALSEKNIRIPKDISIVSFGCNDTLISNSSIVTCAIQPAYDFGALGTQLLMERIRGKAVPTRKIILQADLQFRQSTAPIQQ